MSYKIGSVCAIYGCNNYKQQKESKSFFRIPKDKDRFPKWIEACHRKDLDELIKIKEPEYFYRTYTVCSDHFEMQCFRNKNLFSQGLVPGSVPTLLLPNAQINTKRKNRDELVCQESPKKMQEVIYTTDVLFSETSSNDASTSYSRNKSTQTVETQFEMLRQENLKLKLEMKEYKKKLNNSACLVWKYKNENKLLKRKLAQFSKEIVREADTEKVHPFLPS